MSHWMTRVARHAGFDGADALKFVRGASDEEIWAQTIEVCGVDEAKLAWAVASTFQLDVADLTSAEPTAARLLPGSVARKFGVFPIRDDDRRLVLATSNPTSPEAEQEIGFASGRIPSLAIAPPGQIAESIANTYSADLAAASLLARVSENFSKAADVEFEMDEEPPEEISEADTASSPIVRLTNIVLHEAVARGASDIHIQPLADGGVVRFRTDGVLQSGLQMPLPVLTRVISRIKIMSRLDIADRLRPQDGRARIAVAGRKYDLRISTVPTRSAEKAVIRILDSQATGTLNDTRIDEREIGRIRDALATRDGIFVVTGPTGSGKTTTLYGALREIATEDVNIMTVEDPVEYELPGLTQIQVETKQGVTFASALRAILRQDPDVIFVGEIRDPDTAGMAAQASLTGHLVLASLHTNDAVGSIRRLVDLGLDASTVGDTLRGALAQRLVRRVCAECVEPATAPFSAREKQLEKRFGVPPTVRSIGCERCAGHGYLGRIPIVELMMSTPDLVRLILAGAPIRDLQEQAKRDGMRTLLESALDRVRAGETTLEEVDRVVGAPGQASSVQAAAASPPSETPPQRRVPAPLSEAPRASSAGPAMAGVDEGGGQPSVLLVDDDATTRLLARSLLEESGMKVSEATDGSEALARLAKGEYFTLMVLDLEMPMLGGREVLRAVRQSVATGGLPVVVLTGASNPQTEVELMEQGADDYIRKPIDPPLFLSRVRAAIRRARG